MTEPLDQSGMQLPEISREEILKQIFGDIGELIDDFTCAVESTVLVHGRMYITNKFICFYSNLFGLEKKIRIPYSHIKAITKENTAMVIPNAIAISTDKKDYIFRSFWDREDCFRILTAFLAKFKGFTDTDSYKPKVITDSDTNLTSVSLTASQIANVSDASIISDHFISDSSVTNVSGAGTGSPTTGETNSNSSSKRGTVRPLSSRTTESDDVYDTESGFRPNSSAGGDQEAMFEQEVAKSKLKISVVTESLPLSLTEFYNLYIGETAPFSFKKYHEAVKDTNLVATPWSELSSSLGHCREIKFFKPVNLPGLASTRGVKVQRFRRFENIGLVICSSTRLEDVPAADTFSVEDMISVRAVEPLTPGGASSVVVEITFQVTFIKSTYMKYIIDRSTNFEMNKWLEAFFAHLKKTSALFREGKVALDASVSPPCSAGDSPVEGAPQIPVVQIDNSLSAATPENSAILSNGKPKNDGGLVSSNAVDLCRLFVFIMLLLYLIRSNFQWTGVNTKILNLERKIDMLDKLLNQVILMKQ